MFPLSLGTAVIPRRNEKQGLCNFFGGGGEWGALWEMCNWRKDGLKRHSNSIRIPRRPRTSACFCAKARLMRVTSHQEDKQHEKTEAELEKKSNIWNVERFWRPQKLLTGLRNHCFKQQWENQLVIIKKYNEHNQKLTEKWSVSEFNKNAKMGSQTLHKGIPWSHFNVIFSHG